MVLGDGPENHWGGDYFRGVQDALDSVLGLAVLDSLEFFSAEGVGVLDGSTTDDAVTVVAREDPAVHAASGTGHVFDVSGQTLFRDLAPATDIGGGTQVTVADGHAEVVVGLAGQFAAVLDGTVSQTSDEPESLPGYRTVGVFDVGVAHDQFGTGTVDTREGIGTVMVR